uniref:Uncharacterized protein n=1 Tax=Physcomitrium patens TaxID=3218 RepID=A0A2K1JEE8_PHYPA|nr:hypothetical protein PHYPA_020185 [Physcomitrium patens]
MMSLGLRDRVATILTEFCFVLFVCGYVFRVRVLQGNTLIIIELVRGNSLLSRCIRFLLWIFPKFFWSINKHFCYPSQAIKV